MGPWRSSFAIDAHLILAASPLVCTMDPIPKERLKKMTKSYQLDKLKKKHQESKRTQEMFFDKKFKP